jgi:hypothetical protein
MSCNLHSHFSQSDSWASEELLAQGWTFDDNDRGVFACLREKPVELQGITTQAPGSILRTVLFRAKGGNHSRTRPENRSKHGCTRKPRVRNGCHR